jgi:PAS domain S-box-containing protein
MHKKPKTPSAADLRRQAEERLANRKPEAEEQQSEADTQRLLHELQVHQIELEMQNDELRNSRNEMEALLEKYTDLYDFAPTGYFSLDERGRILDVNLTGAAMLGVERSLLLNQCFPVFVTQECRPDFLSFLKKVFTGPNRLSCEATLLKADGAAFWAACHGTSALSINDSQKWCRISLSDITAIKQAEETKRHLETVTEANEQLKAEIICRRAVEESLERSEHQARLLLEQSQVMQEQLRLLSRRILTVQEEERKRISRELHDEITQTLIGINVHLETLSKDVHVDPEELRKKIAHTQKLVEKSVNIAHRFAQELRPTVLDDLGLIPALHAFMKRFMKETGIRVSLKTFAEVEQLNSDKRTALYRVAQEALTNVDRHAHASRADVVIKKLPNAVHMQIADNGCSFDVARELPPGENQRLGLLGMKERIEMVGGTLTIESAPGLGTAIHAEVPAEDIQKEHPHP